MSELFSMAVVGQKLTATVAGVDKNRPLPLWVVEQAVVFAMANGATDIIVTDGQGE